MHNAGAKRFNLVKPQISLVQNVLMLHSNNEYFSSDIRNLVVSRIDPMMTKLAFKGMRKISRVGVPIVAGNATELENLEGEITTVHSVSSSKK